MKKIRGIVLIFKMICSYEPLYIVCSFPQAVLTAAQALLAAYFPKLFIEQLTGGDRHADIVGTILIYAGALFAVSMANIFLKNRAELLADRFAKKIRETTGSITMELPVEVMERADFHDRLYMANNVNEVIGAVTLLQGVIAELFTVAGLAAVIAQLGFVFVLLIGAVLAVKAFFVYLMQKRLAKQRVSYAQNDRVGNYLNSVAYYDKGAAKELRLNNLESWFMRKIHAYRDEMLGLQYADFRRYALFEILMSVAVAAQTFFMLWILSAQYIGGGITIADFTMYFSAVTVISVSLSNVLDKLGEYNRMQLTLSDFCGISKAGNAAARDTMQQEHTMEQERSMKEKHPMELKHKTIRFENVSFAYPGSGQLSLENVSIEIAENEKLAIVGENGAGKSTFIKLLCKFYRPTQGRITVGGVDIWDISNEAYNKILSAVFQDYVNFAFTIGENVAMREDTPEERTLAVLEQAGLSERVSRMPGGIHTFLSKKFDRNGIELSGGEGQKLAVSRALYKDSPIVILDEPTASLDPKAENEIYENFFHMAKNRTAIFISHRLAASTKADRIAVFIKGRITEYGTHDQLMERGGVYANMFRKQGGVYSEAVS